MNSDTANDGPRSPHPFRLREGDRVGLDESGERIPVVWPPSSVSDEEAILCALEDAGASFPDRERAGDVLSANLDTIGDWRAAERLAMMASRLPGGRRGDELRAVFFGMVDDESLSETSARHGVCKVTWFKAIQRLRRRLVGKTANDPSYL